MIAIISANPKNQRPSASKISNLKSVICNLQFLVFLALFFLLNSSFIFLNSSFAHAADVETKTRLASMLKGAVGNVPMTNNE